MVEDAPLTIRGAGSPPEAGELIPPDDLAAPLGRGVAQTLTYLIAVLDREDRLESGTGGWFEAFRSNEPARVEAVREGVLRALAIAVDPVNFSILESLAASGSVSTAALAKAADVGELPLGHRIGDLVSGGLATKQPETNQVAATGAGNALVDWVHQAVAAGAVAIEQDLP